MRVRRMGATKRTRARLAPRAVLAGLTVLVLTAGCSVASGTTNSGPTASGTTTSGTTTSRTQDGCSVSPLLVPACGAWWGMFVPTPNGTELNAAVAAQDSSLGRPLDLILLYHDMSTTQDGMFPSSAEEQLSQHHLLVFSWAPVIWSTGQMYSWEDISSGGLDQSVIIPEAMRLKDSGTTVFLSLFPEADATAGTSQGSPSQFVAAWRHVHNLFAELKVRNVVWVWTTTGYLPHTSTIAAMYPGNSYVDWIGYDPYNYFSCRNSPWRSFSQTIGPFYEWLSSRHYGKPIMLTEYGTSADPANPDLEVSWYQGIKATIKKYSGIKALNLWNSATTQCDFTLSNQSTQGQAAYRQAGLAPYFRQQLP
jgi:hypothetical protein